MAKTLTMNEQMKTGDHAAVDTHTHTFIMRYLITTLGSHTIITCVSRGDIITVICQS